MDDQEPMFKQVLRDYAGVTTFEEMVEWVGKTPASAVAKAHFMNDASVVLAGYKLTMMTEDINGNLETIERMRHQDTCINRIEGMMSGVI